MRSTWHGSSNAIWRSRKTAAAAISGALALELIWVYTVVKLEEMPPVPAAIGASLLTAAAVVYASPWCFSPGVHLLDPFDPPGMSRQ